MRYLLLIIVMGWASALWAGDEKKVSDDIAEAKVWAERLAREHGGPQHVLFATDLDNTMLQTAQDLGGEPWFNWQNGLLADPQSPFRVSCDFADLLVYNRVLMSVTQYRPVQTDQHLVIQALQSAGFLTMAQTSRGVDLASVTFDHLKKAGIDFSKHRPDNRNFSSEPYLPFDLDRPADYGLTGEELKRWGVTKVKEVYYARGVLFGEGQHKGALLRSFLHRTQSPVRAVVFWDNEARNVERVYDAFARSPIDVVAIRASRQDKDIERFEKADKQPVDRDFALLRKSLDEVFQYPRPCALPRDLR